MAPNPFKYMAAKTRPIREKITVRPISSLEKFYKAWLFRRCVSIIFDPSINDLLRTYELGTIGPFPEFVSRPRFA